MLTQFIMHERIYTTEAKAKALKLFATRVFRTAIRSDKYNGYFYFNR